MKAMLRLLSLLAIGAISLSPVSAFAHTGVGSVTGFWSGVGHPISGADHMLAMVAVGLWAAQIGGRAVWAVPGSFVTLMLIGGVLGMSGMPLPYVEQGILVSVLVMGMLIAFALRLPIAISMIIAGIFAVFHGHAHGAEMPSAMSALSYSAGFALATALLHAAGIGGGTLLQKLGSGKVTRFAGAAIALGGVYLAVI